MQRYSRQETADERCVGDRKRIEGRSPGLDNRVVEDRTVGAGEERLNGRRSVNEQLMKDLLAGRIQRRAFVRRAVALGLSASTIAALLTSYEGSARARSLQATP